MAKGGGPGGHLNDGSTSFNNSSRTEPKRSHQWFADAAEPELFSKKKQAVQAPNSKSTTVIFNPNTRWENASSFQLVPNQFIDRLFGSETTEPTNFADINIAPFGTDNSNMRNKGISEEFGNDSSMGLSISPTLEDPETCLSYGGIRKIKVNQVKDSDDGLHEPEEHNGGISTGEIYNRGNETSFRPMGPAFNKEDDGVMMVGPTYNRSMAFTCEKGNDNAIQNTHMYSKGEPATISFGGFHPEADINTLAQPISNYEFLYDQSSVQTSETISINELDTSNANTVVSAFQLAKSRAEIMSKIKLEAKMGRKEAPNSFPSNVRSLISTGMLDGVPVKYISVSREFLLACNKELRGNIKGSGYLCGCPSCNYSKVLNAYEFERHAGSKTKHPNNHIYFVNGKTIYQIVQELRSTPESCLFDAIQTMTGSPINQKSFHAWKESFQAATRELHRIYGKEELNL